MNKNKKSSIFAIIGKIVITLVVAYIIFFGLSAGLSILQNKRNMQYEFAGQKERVTRLKGQYQKSEIKSSPITEITDIDFIPSVIGGAKFNRLRYLATHNSYKTGLNKTTKFFYNYPAFFLAGKKYNYKHENITEQLKKGIRSFELDVDLLKYADEEHLTVMHHKLFETYTSMIDFSLGLEEIKMWMDNNAGHMPIVVLLEPKSSKNHDKIYSLMEKRINQVFKEKALKRKDLLNGYSDFNELRKNDGYSSIASYAGKILFVVNEKKGFKDSFNKSIKADSLLTFAMTAKTLDESPEYQKDVMYVIKNNALEIDAINKYADKNFLIRTRVDEYSKPDAKRLQNAIKSRANILSTDYPPRDEQKDTYTAVIKKVKNKKAITLDIIPKFVKK